MELTLAAAVRDTTSNTKNLREQGTLPAVVYGRSQESTPISVNRKEFEKIYRQAGESAVITLTGLGAAKDVLIHEATVHPVSGAFIHADFYAIEKGQKVTVSVPFVFEGVSPAVKDKGGILTKVMYELELECEPKDLPHSITVDISKLVELDDQIKVSDLSLPKTAEVSVDLDEVVAMISVAEEEKESEPVDISQIGSSVERGKKEEAEEAAE